MPLDTMNRFRLTGRTALVTGARREIGRAIALALAGAGARLAIHHAGTAEEARDADGVVTEIQQAGGQARAFGQDFVLDDAGHHLAAAVSAWSPVDILVLNASIELPEDYRGITREHFDRQIAVNLRTTLELLQTLVPPMGERGWGRVVTIGSVQQVRPHPRMLVYAGTKAAQLNWARNLARQFGGQGVTANNLAPGAILYPHDWNHDSWLLYARDRQLRPDVVETGQVIGSDAALVIHERHFSEFDFQIWNEYGHVQPAEVLTLDGVPLVSAYRRAK